jgi:hypothetical protein
MLSPTESDQTPSPTLVPDSTPTLTANIDTTPIPTAVSTPIPTVIPTPVATVPPAPLPPPTVEESDEKYRKSEYNLEQVYTRNVTGINIGKNFENPKILYCYNSLDQDEKTIYSKINEAAYKIQIQIDNIPPKSADEYYYVLEAYLNDHPEVFWIKPLLFYGTNIIPDGLEYFIQLYYDFCSFMAEVIIKY